MKKMKNKGAREIFGLPIVSDPGQDEVNLVIELVGIMAELQVPTLDEEHIDHALQLMVDDTQTFATGLFQQIVEEPELYMNRMTLPSLRKLIALGIEMYGYCPLETLELLQAMQIGWTNISTLDEIMQLPLQLPQPKPNNVRRPADYLDDVSIGAFIKHLHYRTDNYFVNINNPKEVSLLDSIREKVKKTSGSPKRYFEMMIDEFCRYSVLFMAGLSSNELLKLSESINTITPTLYPREEQNPRFMRQLQRARQLIHFAYLGAQKREE